MKDYIETVLRVSSKDSPMDRREMAKAHEVDERKIRHIIQQLREGGVRVVSDSESGGYWIAKTEDEYKRFRAEYISRAAKILDTVKAMDESVEGQYEISGVM